MICEMLIAIVVQYTSLNVTYLPAVSLGRIIFTTCTLLFWSITCSDLSLCQPEVSRNRIGCLYSGYLALLNLPHRYFAGRNLVTTLYLWRRFCFSSIVSGTCFGTSSCLVILTRSSVSKKFSIIFLGAASRIACIYYRLMVVRLTSFAKGVKTF